MRSMAGGPGTGAGGLEECAAVAWQWLENMVCEVSAHFRRRMGFTEIEKMNMWYYVPSANNNKKRTNSFINIKLTIKCYIFFYLSSEC